MHGCSKASRQAAPSPTANNTFSVPARRPPLMSGAVNERLEGMTVSDVESAHSLRRVQLVTGDAHQIDTELVDPRRDLSDRLGRVGV